MLRDVQWTRRGGHPTPGIGYPKLQNLPNPAGFSVRSRHRRTHESGTSRLPGGRISAPTPQSLRPESSIDNPGSQESLRKGSSTHRATTLGISFRPPRSAEHPSDRQRAANPPSCPRLRETSPHAPRGFLPITGYLVPRWGVSLYGTDRLPQDVRPPLTQTKDSTVEILAAPATCRTRLRAPMQLLQYLVCCCRRDVNVGRDEAAEIKRSAAPWTSTPRPRHILPIAEASWPCGIDEAPRRAAHPVGRGRARG